MDKRYVFLICNGIFLVLLAKTSGEEEEEEEDNRTKNGFLNEFQEAELPLCIGTQASYLETSYEVHVRHEDEELLSIKLSECHRPSLNVTLVEYKQDEATSEGQILDKEKEEDGIGGEEYSRTYDVIEADNCEENDEIEEEEVVDESEEPLNKLSTEELNKKFEEFIRKMKEEIRIEARQQLVLVNATTKLLACVYVFSGMALVGIVLSKAADYLVEKQETLLIKAMHMGRGVGPSEILEEIETKKVKYKCFMIAAFLIVLIVVGMVVLDRVERLDTIDAFYCVCATITTLGYGDKLFNKSRPHFCYILDFDKHSLFGSVVAELNAEKRQKEIVKWVLSRRTTNVDLEEADVDNDKFI
ncbi:hypothetical protein K7X08_012439 [Anisodus acutangulus]|uniref:Potassium channel domain-containing protein n=1 Tax=Anisodus acutangulus TaxID=402998 RepID=A0A9Q1LBN6_9SOLA|nr:hypothetical protein K7X08_012439 [Anisodus acutangulus]